MIFFTLLAIFIFWLLYDNAKIKQGEKERQEYLNSPEGIKEQEEQERKRREQDRRYDEQVWVFKAASKFKGRLHHCWNCKSSLKLSIDVKEDYLNYGNYIDDDSQRNEQYEKLSKVICPICGWVKCSHCGKCKCQSRYK